MNFTPESYASWSREHHIPVASEATWKYISTQLDEYRPICILEVGAAVGSTSCRMGTQCAPWHGRVYSYEISYPTYHLARRRRNIRQCWNVHLFHADITQMDLGSVIQEQIDFVFIDGMKAQYAEYLQQIRPFCHSGTCLILDDVRAYADKMDALWLYLDHEALHWEFLELDDGDAVIKILL